ncbi:hypothetical protein ASG19_08675 [Rhizobium sp. Leaf306]|uniref:hypothetical protein n=1 Tax=Rhizobium sp. Leaf306 TaxID=1736330 RepID=UPI00071621DA|nr:hypothetical protein [Rhizobium sp. Leaf306]KQQ36494.1 hypothetical protein ASG19_08675 [Rhizobium sp. Leaf306]
MTNSNKKRRATSLSTLEMNRLAALFHAGQFGITNLDYRRPEGRDATSEEVMQSFVLLYVSPTRPTIAQAYRLYQVEIAQLNSERTPSRHLPFLSKYKFRSAINDLDPFFVMAGRYGFDAAMRFLRRSTPRRSPYPSAAPVSQPLAS